MTYYSDNEIIIRSIKDTDPEILTACEIEQGWHVRIDKFNQRKKDMNDGKCIALVAEVEGKPVGYVNVYIDCKWGAFGGMGYCEIVDFAVLEKYRNKGIGSKLMDIAEEISSKYADTVYLGVGLHNGYGSAQRMYIKRGYIPDGSGVWYGDKVCQPYVNCINDDDLNLYFSKKLNRKSKGVI